MQLFKVPRAVLMGERTVLWNSPRSEGREWAPGDRPTCSWILDAAGGLSQETSGSPAGPQRAEELK